MSNAVYGVVALVAVRLWFRHRTQSSVWVVGAFVSTGLAIFVGLLLPDTDPPLLGTKLVVLGILALPACLHRFVVSLEGIRPVVGWTLDALVLLMAAATLALRSLPAEGEQPSGFVAIYITAFLLLWTILSARTAWRLGAASFGQPGVIRLRLRYLSLASIGLALAIVLPSLDRGSDVLSMVGGIFGAISGVWFLLGFEAPKALRAKWRQAEEAELVEATKGLMAASTVDEVARTVLPSMVGLMGAEMGAIVREDGRVRAAIGLRMAEVSTELDQAAGTVRVPLTQGDELLMRASPFAPLLGQEERRLVDRLATLVTLAYERAALLSSERTARRDAERANREVEAFVATITHDLRNPLTAIVGMSDLLVGPLKEDLSERAATFVARIAANAEYMTGMVRDILDLAQISSSPVPPEPVDLALIAGVVREELALRAPTAELVIGALPTVMGDHTHFRRLIDNVVNNSVKHAGRDDVRITVTATQSSNWLELSFLDNGIGIAVEDSERVFGLFEQVDGDTDGSGLGLAICRKLVESMGGRLWFEPSDVGADLRMQFSASIIAARRTGTQPSRPPATLEVERVGPSSSPGQDDHGDR